MMRSLSVNHWMMCDSMMRYSGSVMTNFMMLSSMVWDFMVHNSVMRSFMMLF